MNGEGFSFDSPTQRALLSHSCRGRVQRPPLWCWPDQLPDWWTPGYLRSNRAHTMHKTVKKAHKQKTLPSNKWPPVMWHHTSQDMHQRTDFGSFTFALLSHYVLKCGFLFQQVQRKINMLASPFHNGKINAIVRPLHNLCWHWLQLKGHMYGADAPDKDFLDCLASWSEAHRSLTTLKGCDVYKSVHPVFWDFPVATNTDGEAEMGLLFSGLLTHWRLQ